MGTPVRMTVQKQLDEKADKKPLITTADATDLASAIVLLNEIKAVLNQMNEPVAE